MRVPLLFCLSTLSANAVSAAAIPPVAHHDILPRAAAEVRVSQEEWDRAVADLQNSAIAGSVIIGAISVATFGYLGGFVGLSKYSIPLSIIVGGAGGGALGVVVSLSKNHDVYTGAAADKVDAAVGAVEDTITDVFNPNDNKKQNPKENDRFREAQDKSPEKQSPDPSDPGQDGDPQNQPQDGAPQEREGPPVDSSI